MAKQANDAEVMEANMESIRQTPDKCVEAMRPLPLDTHEAVSLAVAVGLDALKQLPEGVRTSDQIEYFTVGGER